MQKASCLLVKQGWAANAQLAVGHPQEGVKDKDL
jgi:hypothetical protein